MEEELGMTGHFFISALFNKVNEMLYHVHTPSSLYNKTTHQLN